MSCWILSSFVVELWPIFNLMHLADTWWSYHRWVDLEYQKICLLRDCLLRDCVSFILLLLSNCFIVCFCWLFTSQCHKISLENFYLIWKQPWVYILHWFQNERVCLPHHIFLSCDFKLMFRKWSSLILYPHQFENSPIPPVLRRLRKQPGGSTWKPQAGAIVSLDWLLPRLSRVSSNSWSC